MIDYSIKFDGINENKNKFNYSLNSDLKRSVILKVVNTYFGYEEYSEELELSQNLLYYTYVPSNNSDRYVEFRDKETLEVVGLFGLEGVTSFKHHDNFGYVKSIFKDLKPGEKHNVYVVFNELVCHEIYNNNFICVEENDIVVDIGFNYGLFSVTSLSKNPLKIIAFEPNPNLVKTFTGFFKNDSVIELHQKAVSGYNGKAIFFENLDPGMSTIYQELDRGSAGDSYDVDVISFNDFIIKNKINRIDYLKVDCEGAEYDIFDSMPNEYLCNNIKKIAIEYHHKFEDTKVQNLIKKLIDCGFETKIKKEENSTIGLIYGRKYGKISR